jgi:hypothetical protein
LIAVKDTDLEALYHFAGYEKVPEDKTKAVKHLMEELKCDKNFKFPADVLKTMMVIEAPSHVLKYFNKVFKEEIRPQLKAEVIK